MTILHDMSCFNTGWRENLSGSESSPTSKPLLLAYTQKQRRVTIRLKRVIGLCILVINLPQSTYNRFIFLVFLPLYITGIFSQ